MLSSSSLRLLRPLASSLSSVAARTTAHTTNIVDSVSVAPSVGRPDRLFARIDLELRAHQPDVLKSYAWVIGEAAKYVLR